jgi:hypothetical protein
MRPSTAFIGYDMRFWAYVRLISQTLGYAKLGKTKVYTPDDIQRALRKTGIPAEDLYAQDAPTPLGDQVVAYLNYRADLLQNTVRPSLMDGDEAQALYESIVAGRAVNCPMPMNKQKGAMRHPNYLTCIVNALTEQTLGGYHFDGDPRTLSLILSGGRPVTVMSRRLDGAYPSTTNATAVWEIKEYYDNTSFGSMIADGVYETLLDGYELQALRHEHGVQVEHYLVIDGYATWWNKGISYLCRLVDAVHMQLVDEVIVGREVLVRWPQIVRSWMPVTR